MNADRDEEIGGALYTALDGSRSPCSARELARKIGVSEEKAIKMLQSLCNGGMVCQRGDQFVIAELDKQESQKENYPNSVLAHAQALAPIATGGNPSQNIVATNDCRTMQCPVDQNDLATNEDAFEKILTVLEHNGKPMKAHVIAKETGLGSAKSAVNRYLYFLESQGVVSKNGAEFILIKHATAEETKVMAAQLAKKPQGKKNTRSATDDCTCPNRGPGCVHNHFTQNVHNHQYKIQIGNTNNIYTGSDRDYTTVSPDATCLHVDPTSTKTEH